jgi:hypothetical protein
MYDTFGIVVIELNYYGPILFSKYESQWAGPIGFRITLFAVFYYFVLLIVYNRK